jgi:RHS repeat-associated protein
VKEFAPGASNPAITVQLVHDAQGHDWKTTETFAAAGYNSIGGRTYTQTFAVSGQPDKILYGDYVGNAGIATSATYHYDARGLPASVDVTRSNQGTQTVAVQTRNVAGLVTNRKTTITGNPTSPMTFVESNWTYDKLGRVASQVVQKGPGPTLVAEQALAYFGNDDPKTLDQYLGSSHKQFSYGYDYRHQLKSADETTTSGYFSGSYEYGTAGRFTRAIEASPSPAPGSEVKPRDVTYHYAGLDPEEVTSLSNTTSGTTYASYAYDASGNQTERCYGTMPCAGESTEYVYDGEDRLRRATKKQNGVVVASEEYWYDGRGSRMATVKRDASGAKSELIWWNHDTEAHYDGAGTLQHVYAYISMGTPVARTDRDGSGTAKLEFTFHGLGNSTLAAVDRDMGVVNASFSYAPFGEIVEATDAGSSAGAGVATHRRRMNDKYVDEVSDLAYYGARYYDNTLMLWTQPDPLFRFAPDAAWDRPRNTLLYTSDLNDPLRYIDPDGRAPFLANLVGQGALYDAVGLGDTSNSAVMKAGTVAAATAIQKGLDALDSVTNPAAYAERGRNEAVAAVESADQGDLAGTYSHLNNAAAETGVAIAMVIFTREADAAPESSGDVPGSGCFVAGTPVATPHGEVPIEQLRLGDRVASDNPRCASDHVGADVRTISLEVENPQHPNGPSTEVEIARPLSWLRGQHFTNGAFWLALPEVGQGWARVTKIGARPDEQQGPGCLVLMTVHHPATKILDFHFADGTAFEVTPLHPLYLEGRGWTVAGEIVPGSVLRSASGRSVVTTIEPGAPNRTVYNLEVSLDHVYRVGTGGVWAHNSCSVGGGAGDTKPTEVTISRSKYPESAKHIEDAQASGQASELTIDRGGAKARRRASLAGTKGSKGMD